MKKIFQTIKAPFKFFFRIGVSPIKFIYNKRKKLIKIISPSNVKIISVKISTMGKRTIVTAVCIVTVIASSGMETQKTIEKSYAFSQNTQIERIVEVPSRGGAVDHLWSPRAKYESTKAARAAKANKFSMSSSTKRPNLRRRLLSIPGSDSHSRSNSGKQIPNPGYKKPAPSLNDNIPKSGRGLRLRSIATMNKDGEVEKTYYPTTTTENLKNNAKKAKLTKVRNKLVMVQDDKLTLDGEVVDFLKLSPDGKGFVISTKARITSPLLQSRYEETKQNFRPVYSPKQSQRKRLHRIQLLQKYGANITAYNQFEDSHKAAVHFDVVDRLLGHPDTELHTNVMAQAREPVFMVLNRGLGDYPVPNHIATFERRPEICEYNPYITDYFLTDAQLKNFDLSANALIKYNDLIGNVQTNIGPIIGEDTRSASPSTSSPTSPSTVNNTESVDTEL